MKADIWAPEGFRGKTAFLGRGQALEIPGKPGRPQGQAQAVGLCVDQGQARPAVHGAQRGARRSKGPVGREPGWVKFPVNTGPGATKQPGCRHPEHQQRVKTVLVTHSDTAIKSQSLENGKSS